MPGDYIHSTENSEEPSPLSLFPPVQRFWALFPFVLWTCISRISRFKFLVYKMTLTDSHNPVWGLSFMMPITQGSSCLATLGFVPESLWDSDTGGSSGEVLVFWTGWRIG